PQTIEFWTQMGEERAVAEYEEEHGLVDPSIAPPAPAVKHRIAYDVNVGSKGGFVVQGLNDRNNWVTLKSFSDQAFYPLGGEGSRKAAESFMRTVGKYEVV